jgi:peptidyl-prolyl cis-trans isomerase D
MQIIQGIREKGAAIVIVVIALSLIGFILMDAMMGRNNAAGIMSGDIGKVNGESIEMNEFKKKSETLEAQEEQQSRQKITPARSAQIREQVWNQIVSERIFYAEAAKLGIDFTPKELNAVLTSDDPANPLTQDPQMIDQATGKLDPNKVSQALSNLKKMKGEQKDMIDAQVIDPQKIASVSTKYYALLNASAYYPSWMETKDTEENKDFANITYVAIPYTVISDSTIKVTDDEIEKYVQKNKGLFKQEAGRMISYVTFSQLPNAADSAQTKQVVESLKESFAADTNAKAFLARNTSLKPLNEDYIWKSKMQGSFKDTIMSLQKGQVFGPYVEEGSYNIAKLLDVKPQPDSVRVRHILIKIADLKNGQLDKEIRPDSVARKLVDSIAAAIKAGADFNEMVLKYSDDAGSKGTKGEYSFTKDNSLVDSFYRTVFYEPAGTKKIVMGIDQGSYVGYHYIEVMGQFKFEPAYKVGYLAKEILASEATINKASLEATRLSAEKDPKNFDSYIKKNGLQKITTPTLIKENDAQAGQLRDARQLVRWVFEAKVGDVSDPYSVGDQFVVAIVDKVFKEGTQDAATARPMVEGTIREQKKAEEIIKKLSGKTTLESVAAVYGKEVLTAGQDSTLMFNSRVINGIGYEPKLIGASFNKANMNKISEPIAGKTGVYVFRLNSISSKAANTTEEAAKFKTDQQSALRSQVTQSWFEGLRNKATVKDNRSKFY